MTEDEATDLSLNELRMTFKHVVTPKNIACFLIEPVQGEGGYYPAPARFLDALREMADEHGIKLLYDEVQSGFGRTAEWFASDHYDAKPDIMAMGKGIANGLPSRPTGHRGDDRCMAQGRPRHHLWGQSGLDRRLGGRNRNHGRPAPARPGALQAGLRAIQRDGRQTPHDRRTSGASAS